MGVSVIHADALIGLSYSWWNDKHNRHHVHPNEPDRAPTWMLEHWPSPSRRPRAGTVRAGW